MPGLSRAGDDQMSLRHIIIAGAFGAGALLAAIGLFSYFRAAFRQASPPVAPVAAIQGRTPADWLYLLALFAIVIVAFVLRIDGIDVRTMTHVEVYIPGIPLPSFAEPPPRLDFPTFLYWHWHDEPHPQGYYLFMFYWSKLFGTGLSAIRLPSVIFGTGAVLLIYLLATRLCDRRVGLIAAALLAFNGHHIYWSQFARMYTMVCFLGMLAAILLHVLLQEPRRRPRLETAYVLVNFAGVFTQLFFWVLLAAQMLIALIYSRHDREQGSRVLSLQVVAALLGSPLWAHAVYRSREVDLGGPLGEFVQGLTGFGFLVPNFFTMPVPVDIPLLLTGAVTVLALLCLVAGLFNRRFTYRANAPVEPAGDWKRLIPVAAGFALIIVALALLAWRRQTAISVTALVPLLALATLPVTRRLMPGVRAALARCPACTALTGNGITFLAILCMIPSLLLILVSLFKTMLIARGFMLFVPFLLIIQAAGVELVSRRRLLAIPLLAALAVVHFYSVDYYRTLPGPTDYQTLAQQITDRMATDDLVFVYPNDYVTTPLYYYYQGEIDRFIPGDYAATLAAHPGARVWIVLFEDYKQPSEEMRAALQDYRVIERVSAHGCSAELYAPVRP